MMLAMKEWKAVRQFGIRALRTTPADPHLWREILLVLLKSSKSIPFHPVSDLIQALPPPKQK